MKYEKHGVWMKEISEAGMKRINEWWIKWIKSLKE